MAKKISELTTISSVDNSDVIPIVDVSANTTNKVTLANIKSDKQNTLVSGTNIKTINGTSILGSGNLTIPDIVYRDWSQQFSCATGMTTGSITVPTISGYTCIANVLRSTSSNYMIYELSANGAVKVYNHSSGTLNVTIYGRFIYVRNT